MFAILITDSTGQTHIHPISTQDGSTYTLGRSPECNIALPQEVHLSRTHCLFTVSQHRLYLQDNNSSNGIYNGARRVTAEYMAPGREYQIGNCTLVLIHTTLPAEQESHPASNDTVAETEPPITTPADDVVAPSPLPLPTEQPAPIPPAEQQDAPSTATEIPIDTMPAPRTRRGRQLRCHKVPPRKLPGVYKPEPKKKRPAPKAFRTAAGKSPGPPAPSKQLRTRRNDSPAVQYAPAASGALWGLPADFEIELQLLNTTATLPIGTALRFAIRATEQSYAYLLHFDCQGTPTQLVPGIEGDDNRLFAGIEMQFPRACDNEYELVVEAPTGKETVIALACSENIPAHKLLEGLGDTSLRPTERVQQALSGKFNPGVRWASAVLAVATTD